MTIAEQISRSQQRFRDLVWPVIQGHLGGGDLVAVEGENELLDMYAGIDAWQVLRDSQCIYGIGSRVQTYWSFGTLTVRAVTGRGNGHTEFSKRVAAIADGALYPKWTVHAYVPEEHLHEVAVIRTTDLFGYLEPHVAAGRVGKLDCGPDPESEIGLRTANADGAVFLHVPFDVLPGVWKWKQP